MRWLSTLCLFAVCVAVPAADEKKASDDKKSAKVKVTSLSISKAPPAKRGTFGRPNGVRMETMVSLPGRFIVGLDPKTAKLDSFTDDKSNVLFKKGGGLFGGANWLTEFGMLFDPDGESVAFEIIGTNPPGKGAEKILLKGSLNVKVGSEEKATDKKEMALKPKEEAEVGPFKVQVNQFVNRVEVLTDEENIKKVEFFDDKDKPIQSGRPGRARVPADKGKMVHQYSYFLIGNPKKFTIKVHYFTKVESVTVPLDLRVGLDLE